MKRQLLLAAGLAAVLCAAASVIPVANAASSADGDTFVSRSGADLRVGSKPFTFTGSNNYYLMYKSKKMVDDVINDAAAAGYTVLRTMSWIDIGNLDGANSIVGKADGVYFQYWDGTKPAYNDGSDGLQHLDYVVWKARQAGLRLVLPLTNNWTDFGGMDQYVRWAGGSYHDDFYTDATIRQWYKNWIAHLLNRVNPLTGLAYKNDPTIMTWELSNEPRCAGSGVYPTSATCTTDTTTTWADDVSRYIKSVDPKHLVSSGDEGFFCDDRTSYDYMINCAAGIDSVRLAALPAMDVMSYHLYPKNWGKTAAWGTDWIVRHTIEADKIGKAVMLGEFGYEDKSTRNAVYQTWIKAAVANHSDGMLNWMLAGVQDDDSPYLPSDVFNMFCPSPVCQVVANAGKLLAGAPAKFRPIADNDSAVAAFDTATTLNPTTNDVAYGNDIVPRTVDLRPDVEGQQRAVTVTGGTLTSNTAGVVTFTPTAGFVGKATASYLVRDHHGTKTNVATIEVTVKPKQGAVRTLFGFEDGTQGWAPGNWQTDAGTVTQTSAFHTEGEAGMHIVSNGAFWFGSVFAEPVDFTHNSTLAFDLKTGAAGTPPLVALQAGSGWTWCQGNKPWVGENQTTTVTVDIAVDLASCTGLDQVHGVLIFLSAGEFDIDNIRLN